MEVGFQIAYQKGVVCCEQYLANLTGEIFSDFARDHFPEVFERSANPRGKLFLQDGDPRQNSKKAKVAFDDISCKQFSIPPRSPDVNPIENFFHIIRNKLHEDALSQHTVKEDFATFSTRVRDTICSYPTDIIDKTIESMGERMDLIIAGKGHRTKY